MYRAAQQRVAMPLLFGARLVVPLIFPSLVLSMTKQRSSTDLEQHFHPEDNLSR
jgi:hypothetical protein